ncbi:unnamed protein product [Dracunculus medinensis]|uniref:Saposin B-type domain-containing protein n=1 Tax=Dracunculus medinensis TaxID=318479 RepID=A0A0N4U9W5_DRAME|nr:unnamed protein product [Dracunculus medinensis]
MRFLIVFIAMCFIVSDAMVVSRAMNNGTFCDVCEKFIGDVRDHMQKVGECTRKQLEKWCAKKTNNDIVQQICDAAIKADEDFLKWLKENMEPYDVCAKMHLC